MKNPFSKIILTGLGALALTFTVPASAQEESPHAEELKELRNEIQDTFGGMLQQALEDAVKGWDEKGAEPREFEDLLGRLFQGDSGSDLTEKDIQRWLGDDFLKRLREGIEGDGKIPPIELDFEKSLESGELEDFARFLQGIGGLRSPGDFEKENKKILEAYRPLSEKGSASTARLLVGTKQVALATVVGEKGYLLTKASELGSKDTFTCALGGGLEIDARLVDVHAPYDLALLKVDAEGLQPVQWADKSSPVQTGSFVLAPGLDPLPLAVGVVSVLPRSLSDSDKGFLGVQLEQKGEHVSIRAIVPGSPAEKAGLEAGDLILRVDEKEPKTISAFIDEVKTRRPGETVEFRYARDKKEASVTVTLADRTMITAGGPRIQDPFNAMGGRLSTNRGGYPMALQTDLTLRPEECGGPLLDLDGNTVGINIARSGRVMSYAIPAAAIRDLLGDLPGGKFAKRDLKALEEEHEVAKRKLNAARMAFETAKKQAEAAQKALDAARE